MKPTLLFLTCATLLATGCSLYESTNPQACKGQIRSLRNPHSGLCERFGSNGYCDLFCGEAMDPPPASCPIPPGTPAHSIPTWGVCPSPCSGLAENACLATPGCRAAYIDPCSNGGCPAGTGRQVPVYDACWATDQTGPIEGGGCKGLDADACSRHDDCVAVHANACADGDHPADPTTCGVGNFEYCAPERPHGCSSDADCASGSYCDTSDCPKCNSAACETCYGTCKPDLPPPPPPPPACDTITDEATCIGRTDCTPRYQGVNCTCDASGTCTCRQWLFSSCAAAQPTD